MTAHLTKPIVLEYVCCFATIVAVVPAGTGNVDTKIPAVLTTTHTNHYKQQIKQQTTQFTVYHRPMSDKDPTST